MCLVISIKWFFALTEITLYSCPLSNTQTHIRPQISVPLPSHSQKHRNRCFFKWCRKCSNQLILQIWWELVIMICWKEEIGTPRLKKKCGELRMIIMYCAMDNCIFHVIRSFFFTYLEPFIVTSILNHYCCHKRD